MATIKRTTMRELDTITVGELRDLLSQYDDDAPVVVASDYGDRGHTQQVHALCGRLSETALRETAYSDSGYAVVDDDAPLLEQTDGDYLLLS